MKRKVVVEFEIDAKNSDCPDTDAETPVQETLDIAMQWLDGTLKPEWSGEITMSCEGLKIKFPEAFQTDEDGDYVFFIDVEKTAMTFNELAETFADNLEAQ